MVNFIQVLVYAMALKQFSPLQNLSKKQFKNCIVQYKLFLISLIELPEGIRELG